MLFPEYIGDNRNIMSTGGNNGQGWDLRPANVIQYNTPDMNGFTFTYNYSADTTAATGVEDNRRRADSLGLKYAKGPLYVNFAIETHRLSSIADGGKGTEQGQRLGASYNFGAFKLVAMHQDLSDLGGTVSGGTKVKRTSYVVGGAFTAGNNVFKAQYVKAAASNTSTGASATDTGAKLGRSVGIICSRRPPRCTSPMPRPTTTPTRPLRSMVRRPVLMATSSPRLRAETRPVGRSA